MDITEEIKERVVWKKPLKKEEATLPTIDHIKPVPYNCEDCGIFQTENRVVDHRFRCTPFNHWCLQCRLCGKYKNPETDRFELNGTQYNTILRRISAKRNK